VSAGAWVAAAAAGVAVLLAGPLRRSLPAPLIALALGLAGGALAVGGMLTRPDPSTGEVALAVALMTVLVPAHVRIVLGPFGPGAREAGA
jgi:hypothetical protein